MTNKFLSAAQFAKNIAANVYLFKKIWKENTTALLLAPREVDKTAIALDIALDITKTGREIIYIDTARSIENHLDRIRNAERLSIFTPAFESPDDPSDYADIVIAGIEEAVSTTGIRTFIIDSVTLIAALSFGRNASPAYVMKRLVALQMRCGISILVIAHQTTKSVTRALTDLADCQIPVEDSAEPTTTIVKTAQKTRPAIHALPAGPSKTSPHSPVKTAIHANP